jgi:hypothetical protein
MKTSFKQALSALVAELPDDESFDEDRAAELLLKAERIANASTARAGATEAQQQQQATDLATFREYRRLQDANPFAAATLMSEHLASIERGRELEDEPPPAAA